MSVSSLPSHGCWTEADLERSIAAFRGSLSNVPIREGLMRVYDRLLIVQDHMAIYRRDPAALHHTGSLRKLKYSLESISGLFCSHIDFRKNYNFTKENYHSSNPTVQKRLTNLFENRNEFEIFQRAVTKRIAEAIQKHSINRTKRSIKGIRVRRINKCVEKLIQIVFFLNAYLEIDPFMRNIDRNPFGDFFLFKTHYIQEVANFEKSAPGDLSYPKLTVVDPKEPPVIRIMHPRNTYDEATYSQLLLWNTANPSISLITDVMGGS